MASKQGIIKLYKKLGETPLESILNYKKENPDYQNEPMSYLGRLDPMAEGELWIAVGEENKNREEYLKLPKEYEFEVLFGFETDTYDLLGVANNEQGHSLERGSGAGQARTSEFSVENIVRKQKYPPYSSKTVNGKPLWQWAREGKLNEIEIPTIEVEIYSLDEIGESNLSGEEVLKEIKRKISLVKGDFRQAEVIESWEKVMEGKKEQGFIIKKYKVRCSSGTYVRSIANDWGGVAFSIKRTKVG
jgi:tRNA pseudouridine(55) synthase